MNNRFEFRAWDKEEEIMIYFEFGFIDNYLQADLINVRENIVLMQWTGILDDTHWEELEEKERESFLLAGNLPKNWKGKKIFEDDIIIVQGIKYHVFWAQSECCWMLEKKINDVRDFQELTIDYHKKVIGNIRENKELLDG